MHYAVWPFSTPQDAAQVAQGFDALSLYVESHWLDGVLAIGLWCLVLVWMALTAVPLIVVGGGAIWLTEAVYRAAGWRGIAWLGAAYALAFRVVYA